MCTLLEQIIVLSQTHANNFKHYNSHNTDKNHLFHGLLILRNWKICRFFIHKAYVQHMHYINYLLTDLECFLQFMSSRCTIIVVGMTPLLQIWNLKCIVTLLLEFFPLCCKIWYFINYCDIFLVRIFIWKLKWKVNI